LGTRRADEGFVAVNCHSRWIIFNRGRYIAAFTQEQYFDFAKPRFQVIAVFSRLVLIGSRNLP
jgi:hypothetical protein